MSVLLTVEPLAPKEHPMARPRGSKKADADKPKMGRQHAFRLPVEWEERMLRLSSEMGLDTANFLRMFFIRFLPRMEKEHEQWKRTQEMAGGHPEG